MATSLTLVIGLPGVGKSTVAKILAEKTGAVVLNSDVIRRELFPDKREYSPEETGQMIQESERRTKEYLQSGTSVVLDAVFTKRHQRDYYRQLAKELGVDFRIVHVTAPEGLVKERMHKRQELGDVSEADFSIYLDRKKHFEPEEEAIAIANDEAFVSLRQKVESLP